MNEFKNTCFSIQNLIFKYSFLRLRLFFFAQKFFIFEHSVMVLGR